MAQGSLRPGLEAPSQVGPSLLQVEAAKAKVVWEAHGPHTTGCRLTLHPQW